MNEEVSRLVYYRLERANESIREAELLLEAKAFVGKIMGLIRDQ